MKTKNPYAGLRWTARIVGTLLVLFTLFMAIGETVEGYQRAGKASLEALGILQIITFIFWFSGLAGLIWAWWKEGTGGLFSLICTAIFIILVEVNPEARFTPILLIFFLPSVLYILYWWLTKKSGQVNP